MESHKQAQAAAELPRRSPILLILAVFAVIAVIAGAFYLGLQKSAIKAEQDTLDAEISQLQAEITNLEGQKVQAAQMAQEWLAEIKAEEILWSHVINRIQRLIPVDPLTGTQKIIVMSYSGGSDGRLVLNAQTVPRQQEPYEFVSELLSTFNSSADFSEAIIPSITSGETDQGEKFLSFSMTFNYTPAAVAPAEPQDGQDESAASTQEKVSRQ